MKRTSISGPGGDPRSGRSRRPTPSTGPTIRPTRWPGASRRPGAGGGAAGARPRRRHRQADRAAGRARRGRDRGRAGPGDARRAAPAAAVGAGPARAGGGDPAGRRLGRRGAVRAVAALVRPVPRAAGDRPGADPGRGARRAVEQRRRPGGVGRRAAGRGPGRGLAGPLAAASGRDRFRRRPVRDERSRRPTGPSSPTRRRGRPTRSSTTFAPTQRCSIMHAGRARAAARPGSAATWRPGRRPGAGEFELPMVTSALRTVRAVSRPAQRRRR